MLKRLLAFENWVVASLEPLFVIFIFYTICVVQCDDYVFCSIINNDNNYNKNNNNYNNNNNNNNNNNIMIILLIKI